MSTQYTHARPKGLTLADELNDPVEEEDIEGPEIKLDQGQLPYPRHGKCESAYGYDDYDRKDSESALESGVKPHGKSCSHCDEAGVDDIEHELVDDAIGSGKLFSGRACFDDCRPREPEQVETYEGNEVRLW